MESLKSVWLDNLGDVMKSGTINYYCTKYSVRLKKENIAVCLPETINTKMFEKSCKCLESYKALKCKRFDPVEEQEGAYGVLELTAVKDRWDEITKMLDNYSGYVDDNSMQIAANANMNICVLSYGKKDLYLFSVQRPFSKLLKGKTTFIKSENEIKEVDASKLFLLDTNIDFAIFPTSKGVANGHVYIFNRRGFIDVFKYYEYLQEQVMKNIAEIDTWKFIKTTEIVKEKIKQKNVYVNLAKIFADKEYMQQIKTMEDKILKSRLINKSNGVFSSSDFDGDKLLVTKSNIENVMKALAKGFRYNFITDMAEDI